MTIFENLGECVEPSGGVYLEAPVLRCLKSPPALQPLKVEECGTEAESVEGFDSFVKVVD